MPHNLLTSHLLRKVLYVDLGPWRMGVLNATTYRQCQGDSGGELIESTFKVDNPAAASAA